MVVTGFFAQWNTVYSQCLQKLHITIPLYIHIVQQEVRSYIAMYNLVVHSSTLFEIGDVYVTVQCYIWKSVPVTVPVGVLLLFVHK